MFSFEETLLYEQLENYQIQRHDFLNNFQVIRGYLQLNMPEKALRYIDETIAELVPQQEIYQVGQKMLLAILMGWFFGLRLKGVEMVINFPPEMKKEAFWQQRWEKEYALQFYGYTKDCIELIPPDENPEDLRAEINFFSLPRGFGSEFKLLNRGEICRQKIFATNEGN
jgi:hypothetical protein